MLTMDLRLKWRQDSATFLVKTVLNDHYHTKCACFTKKKILSEPSKEQKNTNEFVIFPRNKAAEFGKNLLDVCLRASNCL